MDFFLEGVVVEMKGSGNTVKAVRLRQLNG